MEIKIGSVWMKKLHEWNCESGQLVIVENITHYTTMPTAIQYRYTNGTIHNTATWPIQSFLKRMELIKE